MRTQRFEEEKLIRNGVRVIYERVVVVVSWFLPCALSPNNSDFAGILWSLVNLKASFNAPELARRLRVSVVYLPPRPQRGYRRRPFLPDARSRQAGWPAGSVMALIDK